VLGRLLRGARHRHPALRVAGLRLAPLGIAHPHRVLAVALRVLGVRLRLGRRVARLGLRLLLGLVVLVVRLAVAIRGGVLGVLGVLLVELVGEVLGLLGQLPLLLGKLAGVGLGPFDAGPMVFLLALDAFGFLLKFGQ